MRFLDASLSRHKDIKRLLQPHCSTKSPKWYKAQVQSWVRQGMIDITAQLNH